MRVHFLSPEPDAYDGYYNVIANPLLWFLQHSMWDIPRKPIIDRSTWAAWNEGYVPINRLFAEAIIEQAKTAPKRPLVMLHDYHLYLTPRIDSQPTSTQRTAGALPLHPYSLART